MPHSTPYSSGSQPDRFSLAPGRTTVFTSRHPRLEWSWPAVVTIAVVAAFSVGLQNGHDAVSSALDHIKDKLRGAHSQPLRQDRVLILTSNHEKEANAILTLSPHGLSPLLPRTLADVKAMISSHASEIRLTVFDESFPNRAEIGRLLRKTLPSNRIVVLKASSRAEDLGPLLLDRL